MQIVLKRFIINNSIWRVVTVPTDSEYLWDRTGNLTVATTDPKEHCIFVSESIYGDFLLRVIIHEITHVVLWEYKIIEKIHMYCLPEFRISMEEEICNILADYGRMVYETAYMVLGGKAIFTVPYELERLVA